MKAFPWRAGMRALDRRGNPWRVYADGSGGLSGQGEPAGYTADWLSVAELLEAKPDPNDGATKGALLEAVRKLFNQPNLHVRPDEGGYYIERWGFEDREYEVLHRDGAWGVAGIDPICESSEFAALEAAWKAAP